MARGLAIPANKIMAKKAKLEFIARITAPDGKVIERKVEAKDGIPSLDIFDLSSRQAFLESFDAYEKAALEARNKIAEDITGEYLAAVSKKNTPGRK
jgi:hypothetical protein